MLTSNISQDRISITNRTRSPFKEADSSWGLILPHPKSWTFQSHPRKINCWLRHSLHTASLYVWTVESLLSKQTCFTSLGSFFARLEAILHPLVSCSVVWRNGNFRLQWLLSMLFTPLAYLMGVPWKDSRVVGELVGIKTFANEFIAYAKLAQVRSVLEVSGAPENSCCVALGGVVRCCMIHHDAPHTVKAQGYLFLNGLFIFTVQINLFAFWIIFSFFLLKVISFKIDPRPLWGFIHWCLIFPSRTLLSRWILQALCEI